MKPRSVREMLGRGRVTSGPLGFHLITEAENNVSEGRRAGIRWMRFGHSARLGQQGEKDRGEGEDRGGNGELMVNWRHGTAAASHSLLFNNVVSFLSDAEGYFSFLSS